MDQISRFDVEASRRMTRATWDADDPGGYVERCDLSRAGSTRERLIERPKRRHRSASHTLR
jgi:hypothetical protein